MEQLTWQSGLEKITAAIAAGNVPDLCELGSTWMPRMRASGRARRLDASPRPPPGLAPPLADGSMEAASTACRGGGHARAVLQQDAVRARGPRLDPGPETWAELTPPAARERARRRGARLRRPRPASATCCSRSSCRSRGATADASSPTTCSRSAFDSPPTWRRCEFYLALANAGLVERQDGSTARSRRGRSAAASPAPGCSSRFPRRRPSCATAWRSCRGRPSTARHASFAGGEVLVQRSPRARTRRRVALARFLVRRDNALALARGEERAAGRRGGRSTRTIAASRGACDPSSSRPPCPRPTIPRGSTWRPRSRTRSSRRSTSKMTPNRRWRRRARDPGRACLAEASSSASRSGAR